MKTETMDLIENKGMWDNLEGRKGNEKLYLYI